MIGVVLCSGTNEVLQIRGNTYFYSSIRRNEMQLLPVDKYVNESATSSGFTSDSFASRDRHSSEVVFEESEEALVTSLFLPILSIYRTRHDIFADPYRFIELSTFRIVFDELEDHCLLLTFFPTGSPIEQHQKFARSIKTLCKACYGPLLQFSSGNFCFARNARSLFDNVVDRFINGFEKRNFATDFALSERLSLDSLGFRLLTDSFSLCRTALNKISSHFQTFCGDNRCYIFHGSHLLGSVCCRHRDKSNNSKLFCADIAKDVLGILLSSYSRVLTASNEISFIQLWSRDERGECHLRNVYCVNIGDDLTLVCFFNASYSAVVCSLCGLLTRITVANVENSGLAIISETDQLVVKVCDALDDLITDLKTVQRSRPSTPTAFLKNPIRTAAYINSLWKRIRIELSRQLASTSPSNFLRWRSDIGSFSEWRRPPTPSALFHFVQEHFSRSRTEDSVFCQPCNSKSDATPARRKKLPRGSKTLITHFRRQLKHILREVCSISTEDAETYGLSAVRSCVETCATLQTFGERFKLRRQSIGERLPLVSFIDNKTNTVIPCDPNAFQLDMLAYRFSRTTDCMHICFDYDSKRFEGRDARFAISLPMRDDFKSYVVLTKCRCSVKELPSEMIQVKKVTKLFDRKKMLPYKIMKLCCSERHSEEIVECSALFDHFVHPDLALRQTKKLVEALSMMITDSLAFLN
ncbi:hypothetical protein AB6A40_003358 [Gnathostoma spinigerum]|uniref:Uncharacterized protein n=1 Tax=Gnathostoma spinigerum TaxID=75299 RepID=A0ABD6E9C2_9BILA